MRCRTSRINDLHGSPGLRDEYTAAFAGEYTFKDDEYTFKAGANALRKQEEDPSTQIRLEIYPKRIYLKMTSTPVRSEAALHAQLQNSALYDSLQCAVCLNMCVRPCTTSCGHNFC